MIKIKFYQRKHIFLRLFFAVTQKLYLRIKQINDKKGYADG